MTDWVIYVMLFPPYYLTKGSKMQGKDAKQGQKDIRNSGQQIKRGLTQKYEAFCGNRKSEMT